MIQASLNLLPVLGECSPDKPREIKVALGTRLSEHPVLVLKSELVDAFDCPNCGYNNVNGATKCSGTRDGKEDIPQVVK